MQKINIAKLIKEEKYKYLNNYNIDIYRVEINKNNMKMNLFLESDRILSKNSIDDIERLLKSSFTDFFIETNIKYNIDFKSDGITENYIDSLREFIKDIIPSSISWIEGIKFDLLEDSLLVTIPNIIAMHSIDRNGFKKEIKDKVFAEIKHKVEFICVEEDLLDGEIFLEEKFNEEKTITKDILANSSKEVVNKSKKTPSTSNYIFGKSIKTEAVNINTVSLENGFVTIKGEIFQIDTRDIKDNRTLITLYVSDRTDSIIVKSFLSKDKAESFLDNISIGDNVILDGDVIYDTFARTIAIKLKSLSKIKKEVRMDNAKEKRIELHLHTKMSSMDGISNVEKLIERAHQWGHEAIAITDHGVVQAFPNAMEIGRKLGIKIIYGVEGYLVNDKKQIITSYYPDKDYNEFVVFDIETTGLSALNDAITEIGAIKIKDGQVIDSFSQLINPEREIPEFITNLTGITDKMVANKPTIDQVILEFYDFIKGSVLVAHNASFDVGFIREKLKSVNLGLYNPVFDTLELARAVFPDLRNHKLDTIAQYLDVNLDNHHRAVDDATATKDIFVKIMDMLKDRGIYSFNDINDLNSNRNIAKDEVFHVIILAQNLQGLKNLYRIISESHLTYFHRRPRIPKSLIEENREGLLIGSACEAGELYKGILKSKSYTEIRNIVKFYDYLEIQPIGNNMHLVRNGVVKDTRQLEEINLSIYELGQKYKKPVVATGDVHFLEPEDEVYRRILMTGQGFQDADIQPPLYLMTTEEMLDEFRYLGEEKTREVVILNPNRVNNMIEDINPIPDGTYPPIIEGAEDDLRKITYNRAYEIYGNPLPDIVEKRLERELTSIINNGYAVMYIIAQKLVWKSLEDGYLVGSRGSVGSSFAATMAGITEVNPLKPHYICPNCKHSEFYEDGSVASGTDLPEKECPKCNSQYIKDGQDIPFEVFLGFEGDKEPDIDLNFASEYQSKAHKYTEELFGEGYVFRAGTIGTIAEKTAYGFVKKYHEEKGIDVNPAEINRLVLGCTGVKRTSGQHPGGVMIVPKHKDILDFTPIQYPADDKNSGVITTHFDYNAISSNILKLDILGHDVPSIIKMLEDITGINPQLIPLDDKETMKLFTSTEPLKVTEKEISCKVGTLGVPEFGTRFVRQMLVETQPANFSDLVRISGLSHGTDVWINNAQDLVKSKQATISEVISTREDIMLYLINAGLDNKKSFYIMEKVRKGRGLSEEDEREMRALDLPPWYIDSCNKIKYMFPKAHAVAYVMMSFRIAYFKVHYPEAFYASYFTTKAADFDAQLILQGEERVKDKIKELESLGNDCTSKEKNLISVLEVVREMYARGYRFEKVDLYKSHSDKFFVGKDGILPPLKGLDGVGENAARKIVGEREIARFISIQDMIERTKVTKTVIEALRNHGCLEGLPQSNQLSLFSI